MKMKIYPFLFMVVIAFATGLSNCSVNSNLATINQYSISITSADTLPYPIPDFTNGDGTTIEFSDIAINNGSDMPYDGYAVTMIEVANTSGLKFDQLNSPDYAQVIGGAVSTSWYSGDSWPIDGDLDISTNGFIGDNYYYVTVCIADNADNLLCSDVYQLNTTPVKQYAVTSPSYGLSIIGTNTTPSPIPDFVNGDGTTAAFNIISSNTGSSLNYEAYTKVVVASASNLTFSQLTNSQIAQVIDSEYIYNWPSHSVLTNSIGPKDISKFGQTTNYYYAVVYMQDWNNNVICEDSRLLNQKPVIQTARFYKVSVNSIGATPTLPEEITNNYPEDVTFNISCSNYGSIPPNSEGHVAIVVTNVSGLNYNQLANSQVVGSSSISSWPRGDWTANIGPIDISQYGQNGNNYYYAIVYMSDWYDTIFCSNAMQLNSTPVQMDPPQYRMTLDTVVSPAIPTKFTNGITRNIAFNITASNTGSSMPKYGYAIISIAVANLNGLSFDQLTNSQMAQVITHSSSQYDWSSQTAWSYNIGPIDISKYGNFGNNYYYAIVCMYEDYNKMVGSYSTQLNSCAAVQDAPYYKISIPHFSSYPTINDFTNGDGTQVSFNILASNAGSSLPSGNAYSMVVVASNSGLSFSQLTDSQIAQVVCSTSAYSWGSYALWNYNSGMVDISQYGFIGNNYYYAVSYMKDSSESILASEVKQLNTSPVIITGNTFELTGVSTSPSPIPNFSYYDGTKVSFTVSVSNTGPDLPSQYQASVGIYVSDSTNVNTISQFLDYWNWDTGIIDSYITNSWASQTVISYNTGPVDITKFSLNNHNRYFYAVAYLKNKNGTIYYSKVQQINSTAVVQN